MDRYILTISFFAAVLISVALLTRQFEKRRRQGHGHLRSPATTLSAFHERECCVERREADWNFNFGDGFNIAVSVPWRVVTPEGIAHGDEDDGQWFGLSQPVDGEARTNELLRGQKVVSIELDEQAGDLHVAFDGGARLDLFNNSSGYEGWFSTVNGLDGQTVVALGGGSVIYYDSPLTTKADIRL